MSHFFHTAFHVAVTGFQFAQGISPFIPQPYGAIVQAALAAIQGGVAVYQKVKASKSAK